MSYSNNPYHNYVALGSSEGLCLEKVATLDWKSPLAATDQATLLPTDGQKFVLSIKEQAKAYGYALLTKKVPVTRTADPTNVTTFFISKTF